MHDYYPLSLIIVLVPENDVIAASKDCGIIIPFIS